MHAEPSAAKSLVIYDDNKLTHNMCSLLLESRYRTHAACDVHRPCIGIRPIG